MNLYHGQILLLRRTVVGKPKRVVVLDKHPESEYLVRLRGDEGNFFLNRSQLEKFYTDKGVQQELFPKPKTILQRKYLKA